jgi:chromosome segregation ATPase
MLIALGFLAAVLLGLLIAPALWRRAVRLTTHRIKTTMPLSEREIEADRDRIRAEYAIKMHKLEMFVEQVKLVGARQQIEINRRDAQVNMLEADLERLKAAYEEAQNARRVLEQTIEERLPRVEERLAEAKKVLHAREREVAELNAAAGQQVQALASARALSGEHQTEIRRLNDLLSEKVPAGEAGLRAELQSLKAKTREQAQLIERLQNLSPRRGKAAAQAASEAKDEASARQAELEHEIAALRARNEDQAAEIARHKAAIEVFERNADSEMLGSVRESRLALKARMQALEAQALQQGETIARLRSELAAANERVARQASHFTGELKRLGSGSGRGAAALAPHVSLAERIAKANVALEDEADRVASPAETAVGAGAPAGDDTATPGAEAEAAADTDAASPAVSEGEPGGGRAAHPDEPAAGAAPSVAKQPARVFGKRSPALQRPRLLDRLSGLSRTS